jgi:hypothetical protein
MQMLRGSQGNAFNDPAISASFLGFGKAHTVICISRATLTIFSISAISYASLMDLRLTTALTRSVDARPQLSRVMPIILCRNKESLTDKVANNGFFFSPAGFFE